MWLLLTRLLFTVLAVALAWLAWSFPREPWSSAAARLNDQKFQHNEAQPDAGVVFLNVDEAAVRLFGRWPWDRQIIAEHLAKLDQASAVVLDMVFSEPTTEEADAAMEDSFYALGNVIGGLFFRATGRVRTSPEALDALSLSALERLGESDGIVEFPGSPFVDHNVGGMLEAAAMNATFSIIPDADLIMRHYTLAFRHEGFLLPTLGVQALRFKHNQDVEVEADSGAILLANRRLPVRPDGSVRLNFYREENYRSVSFAELATGVVGPEDFAGKIVIFGISEAGVTDIVPTPIGLVPGPWLHLTFVSNFLSNHFVDEDPRFVQGGILFLALIPLLASIVLGNVFLRVILVGACGFGVYHLSLTAYREAFLFVDVFYPLAALGLCLGFQESLSFFLHDRRIRQMRRSFIGGGGGLSTAGSFSPELLGLRGQTLSAVFLQCDLQPLLRTGSAAEVVLVNQFLQASSDCLMRHRAVIEVMNGLGWRAYFGLPLKECGSPADALHCLTEVIGLWRERYDENDVSIDGSFLKGSFHDLQPRLIGHSGAVQIEALGPDHLRQLSLYGVLRAEVQRMAGAGWLRPGGVLVSHAFIETCGSISGAHLIPLPKVVESFWHPSGELLRAGCWFELLPPGTVAEALQVKYGEAFQHLQSGKPREALRLLEDASDYFEDPLAAKLSCFLKGRIQMDG